MFIIGSIVALIVVLIVPVDPFVSSYKADYARRQGVLAAFGKINCICRYGCSFNLKDTLVNTDGRVHRVIFGDNDDSLSVSLSLRPTPSISKESSVALHPTPRNVSIYLQRMTISSE